MKMPSRAETPLTSNYRPEIDVSRELLSPTDAAYYQSLIGILRWGMVELGRVDIRSIGLRLSSVLI